MWGSRSSSSMSCFIEFGSTPQGWHDSTNYNSSNICKSTGDNNTSHRYILPQMEHCFPVRPTSHNYCLVVLYLHVATLLVLPCQSHCRNAAPEVFRLHLWHHPRTMMATVYFMLLQLTETLVLLIAVLDHMCCQSGYSSYVITVNVADP